jgi:hypothetical protein
MELNVEIQTGLLPIFYVVININMIKWYKHDHLYKIVPQTILKRIKINMHTTVVYFRTGYN